MLLWNIHAKKLKLMAVLLILNLNFYYLIGRELVISNIENIPSVILKGTNNTLAGSCLNQLQIFHLLLEKFYGIYLFK